MSLNTYPANPFPPDSERSGGSGEGYTLPIAADDTLGGIKVGDNLTIEEDGTLNAPDPTPAYVLPTAAADTLGGVKVGDNLSIADGVLSADLPVYSTTPVKIGTWIDGKDVMRIVVEYQTAKEIPNNSWVSLSLSNTDILPIHCVGLFSSNGCVPLIADTDNNDIVAQSCRVSGSIAVNKVIIDYVDISESEVE